MVEHVCVCHTCWCIDGSFHLHRGHLQQGEDSPWKGSIRIPNAQALCDKQGICCRKGVHAKTCVAHDEYAPAALVTQDAPCGKSGIETDGLHAGPGVDFGAVRSATHTADNRLHGRYTDEPVKLPYAWWLPALPLALGSGSATALRSLGGPRQTCQRWKLHCPLQRQKLACAGELPRTRHGEHAHGWPTEATNLEHRWLRVPCDSVWLLHVLRGSLDDGMQTFHGPCHVPNFSTCKRRRQVALLFGIS